jgi:hypothetical protein
VAFYNISFVQFFFRIFTNFIPTVISFFQKTLALATTTLNHITLNGKVEQILPVDANTLEGVDQKQ